MAADMWRRILHIYGRHFENTELFSRENAAAPLRTTIKAMCMYAPPIA